MTDTEFVLITVALGVVLGGILLALVGWGAFELAYAVDRRRKRARRRDRIDADGHDALEAWGEPIPVIWPSRAPRNGSPFGDEERPGASA